MGPCSSNVRGEAGSARVLAGLPLLVMLALIPLLKARAAPTVFKVATVAPKDSPWMDEFRAMDREIREATGGEVGFKFFPGMVSGDEKDVVRKMRAGQLQGAALTAVGLQMIEASTLVLQLPLFFRGYKELDYLVVKMRLRIQELMAKKGFVVLGFADLGHTYIFTQTPVAGLSDFGDVKMWGWEDEPISKRFFEMAGISQISLALTEVMPGLQRGMITGVYNSPLGAISLQWDKHVKYITGLSVVIGVGATVLTKTQWDKLSPEHQSKVMEIAVKHHTALRKIIRRKNKEAIAQLKKQGVQVVKVPKPELERFKSLAARVRADLAASLFLPGLLEEAEQHLKAFRAGKR